jgi:hypothetical protein
VYKNRSLSKSFLKCFKGPLSFNVKVDNVTSYLDNKFNKWNYYLKEPIYKSLVEVSKPNKGLYVLNGSKVLLAYNSLDLI